VQRIASERMALSSRCLSRHGCMLCHQVQHTDALLNLDMLVLSHTRSAAQQQVWSRKTTAAAEACKILLLLLLVNPLTALLHRVRLRVVMSLLSENLRHSYASVGLRASCKPSYTRRPLDKFRQLRHLAICDLYSTGLRLQRREPPAQRISRLTQQSAMEGRSTAPPTEDFASLQQLALQAAKTGAEVRCMLASVTT